MSRCWAGSAQLLPSTLLEEIAQLVARIHGQCLGGIDPQPFKVTATFEFGPIFVVGSGVKHRAVVQHQCLAGCERESKRQTGIVGMAVEAVQCAGLY